MAPTTTTTETSSFDWNTVWFSDETISEARQTVLEALFVALSPGSLPSACVFSFDCLLTLVHFVVSSRILDDFTTTFLGTVYFPCTFLKLVYVAQCVSDAEWISEIGETLNAVFNMTIVLSCVAYNFMCLYVANYRNPIPVPVSRYVFAPILLFCAVAVVVPKMILQKSADNVFQFTTQLFGSICLLAQISWNLYTFVCRKIDTRVEIGRLKAESDDAWKANDVVRNANGRLVWASWFSLLLVILAIPQIVDNYVPLTSSWMPWHFLSQSLAQLNALFLSVTIFLVLPTYRSVIFDRCANYNRIIKVEEIRIEASAESAEIPKKSLEKEAEAMANRQSTMVPNVSIGNFRHVAIPIPIPHRFAIPSFHPPSTQNGGQIRIFVAPPRKY